MKFRTEQAREAYAELVAQTGRAIQTYRGEMQELIRTYPGEAVVLSVSASQHVAEMSIDGLDTAIRAGVEVETQMSALAGSLAIAASRDGSH